VLKENGRSCLSLTNASCSRVSSSPSRVSNGARGDRSLSRHSSRYSSGSPSLFPLIPLPLLR